MIKSSASLASPDNHAVPLVSPESRIVPEALFSCAKGPSTATRVPLGPFGRVCRRPAPGSGRRSGMSRRAGAGAEVPGTRRARYVRNYTRAPLPPWHTRTLLPLHDCITKPGRAPARGIPSVMRRPTSLPGASGGA